MKLQRCEGALLLLMPGLASNGASRYSPTSRVRRQMLEACSDQFLTSRVNAHDVWRQGCARANDFLHERREHRLKASHGFDCGCIFPSISRDARLFFVIPVVSKRFGRRKGMKTGRWNDGDCVTEGVRHAYNLMRPFYCN